MRLRSDETFGRRGFQNPEFSAFRVFRISEFGTHQQRHRAVSTLSTGLLGKCLADTAQNGDVRGNPAAWPTLISRPSSLTRARLGLAFSFRCSFFFLLSRGCSVRESRAREGSWGPGCAADSPDLAPLPTGVYRAGCCEASSAASVARVWVLFRHRFPLFPRPLARAVFLF